MNERQVDIEQLIERRIAVIPKASSIAVFLIALGHFMSWIIKPGWGFTTCLAMKANGAFGLMLGAAALWFHGRKSLLTSRILSACVCLIGAVTLFEYLSGVDFGIDQLLAREFSNAENLLYPGRMSPHSAICFFFLGSGALFHDSRGLARKVSNFFFAPVLVISALALVGYLQEASSLYRFAGFMRIAWQDALCFGLLTGGFLLTKPRHGRTQILARSDPAGVMSRRLLAAALFTPVAVAWLMGRGVKHGLFGFELGMALLAFVLACMFAFLVLETARRLQNSELRFKTLFDRMSMGIGEVEVRTGRVISANSKLQEITGYSLLELRELTFKDLTYPDDRASDFEQWLAMIRGEVSSYRAEKRYVRKDGALIWVRVDAAVSRRNRAGEPVNTVGTIQDISAEKEVSFALQRNEQVLRDAVRARDEFASIASHELKTPLTNLLLRAQLAKRGIFGGAEGTCGLEGLPAFLETIETQVLSLNRLVDEMLDLARIRSGRLILKREVFDLNEVVSTVVERLKPQLLSSAGGRPPTIETCGEVSGSWDRARMEQVFTNLMSNVVRYGAGQPAMVRIDLLDSSVRVQVRDHGAGIPKENLESIFGRFGGGATSAKLGGLGVGLYLCRKIVEAHGGTIHADSEVGKGTTFVVELPREERGVDAVEVA